MSHLLVALTSDTEDNHPAYVPGWQKVGSNYDVKESTLRWEWTRYWPDLDDIFRSRGVPVTWLFRVDDGPVKDSMLDLFGDEILELKSHGDEVGIHIHTFTWDPEASMWVQAKNPKHETKIVRRSISMFKRKLGCSPSSVRMGWHTMSNAIMSTLDASGVQVDSSAIPGSSCSGKFGNRDNIFDWSKAPRVPYHPNHRDYQSSGNMRILEIPLSTPQGEKSNLFGAVVSRLSAMRDLRVLLPLARMFNLNPNHYFYISPWWSLSVNVSILETYRRICRKDGIAFIVGSFHACDILDPRTGRKNPTFERYLYAILEKLSSFKEIEVTYTTLSGMARDYSMLELEDG